MNRTEAITRVLQVFEGSNGGATKELYTKLEAMGPMGSTAVNLFRAQKTSTRAKLYRGGERGRGSYRGMAYDSKQWAIDNLCKLLPETGFRWGWGIDEKAEFHRWVLYVDLPTGQVSFHTASRGTGPDYPDKWDGVEGYSAMRIVQWVAGLLEQVPA